MFCIGSIPAARQIHLLDDVWRFTVQNVCAFGKRHLGPLYFRRFHRRPNTSPGDSFPDKGRLNSSLSFSARSSIPIWSDAQIFRYPKLFCPQISLDGPVLLSLLESFPPNQSLLSCKLISWPVPQMKFMGQERTFWDVSGQDSCHVLYSARITPDFYVVDFHVSFSY